MAKKYYPEQWKKTMVDHLHDIGRLTDEEYYDIVGVDEEEE